MELWKAGRKLTVAKLLALIIGGLGFATGLSAPFKFFEDSPVRCVSSLETKEREGLLMLGEKRSDRTAFFALSEPRSAAELEKANQVLVLAAHFFSRDRADLPIESLRFVEAENGRHWILPRVFPGEPVITLADDSVGGQKFGKFMQEGYYFFPARFLKVRGELWVKFAGDRGALPLQKFPTGASLSLALQKATEEDSKRVPDPALVATWLKQQFCFGSRS